MQERLMICNKSGKTSLCGGCPEGKPHVPQPRNLSAGTKILQMFCVGDTALAEVKLVRAPPTQ